MLYVIKCIKNVGQKFQGTMISGFKNNHYILNDYGEWICEGTKKLVEAYIFQASFYANDCMRDIADSVNAELTDNGQLADFHFPEYFRFVPITLEETDVKRSK